MKPATTAIQTMNWSTIPLQILAQVFGNLYPDSVIALACAQATCHHFQMAVHEVNNASFTFDFVLRKFTLWNSRGVDVQALGGVEEVRSVGTGHQIAREQYRQRWLVQNIPKLRTYVYFYGNLRHLPNPSEWPSSRHLVQLHLQHCSVSDAEMRSFLSMHNTDTCSLPFLEVLVLDSSSQGLTGENWLKSDLLPHLRVLSLKWCLGIDGNCLTSIGPQLTHLYVHGCERVGDEVCLALQFVEDLDIAMTIISDIGLDACTHLQSLRRLTIQEDHENIWVSRHWSSPALENLRAARPDIKIRIASC